MAKAHLFCLTSDAAKLAIIAETKTRGQARQVLNELERDTTPRLGVDIDREISERDPYRTRQDSLRVTLYYLVIFAKRGWVVKAKPIVAEAATEVAEANAFADMGLGDEELEPGEELVSMDSTDPDGGHEVPEFDETVDA